MSTAAVLESPLFDADATILKIVNEEVDAIRAKDLNREVDYFSDKIKSNVLVMPEFKELEFRPSEFFAAIQEWEGVIDSITEDGFVASLYDLSSTSVTPTEIAEISFEDIDPNDIEKARKGAIFRWLIGHSRSRSGQTSRKWVFYFRPFVKKVTSSSIFETIQIPLDIKLEIAARTGQVGQ